MIKNDKENNADNEEDDTWNRTDIAQAQAVFVQLRLNVVTNQASVKSSHTPKDANVKTHSGENPNKCNQYKQCKQIRPQSTLPTLQGCASQQRPIYILWINYVQTSLRDISFPLLAKADNLDFL